MATVVFISQEYPSMVLTVEPRLPAAIRGKGPSGLSRGFTLCEPPSEKFRRGRGYMRLDDTDPEDKKVIEHIRRHRDFSSTNPDAKIIEDSEFVVNKSVKAQGKVKRVSLGNVETA